MNGATDPRPDFRVSVLDPLSRAIDRTVEILFRPFQIEKWFVLGFCAWLARLTEGGGGGGSSGWHGGDRDFVGFKRGVHEAGEWLLENLLPVLIIAGLVVIFVIVIALLLLWLSSRGKFMFLDGVVHNRGAVVDPWNRYRRIANSLFGFRIVLAVCGSLMILGILAVAGLLLWAVAESGDGDALLILTVLFAIVSILSVSLGLALVGLVVKDLLVPIMYLRSCGVGPAWSELFRLFGSRPGAFVLYLVVRCVAGVLIATLGVLACCMTCCLVLLPYIGTVILLPLWVFLRSYPLYFLGQFGPDYARFATLGAAE